MLVFPLNNFIRTMQNNQVDVSHFSLEEAKFQLMELARAIESEPEKMVSLLFSLFVSRTLSFLTFMSRLAQ